jgi:hypothetical protein
VALAGREFGARPKCYIAVEKNYAAQSDHPDEETPSADK